MLLTGCFAWHGGEIPDFVYCTVVIVPKLTFEVKHQCVKRIIDWVITRQTPIYCPNFEDLKCPLRELDPVGLLIPGIKLVLQRRDGACLVGWLSRFVSRAALVMQAVLAKCSWRPLP